MKKIFISVLFLFVFFTQSVMGALLDNSGMPVPGLFGNESVDFSSGFNDVSADTYYANSIVWMHDNGVINGYENGDFGPYNCVNRAEFLKMLYLTLEVGDIGNIEGNSFSDVEEGAWYTPYIKMSKARGTINGYEDGTFKPGQCVNRAEALKIVLEEFGFNSDDSVDNTFYDNMYGDVDFNAWYGKYFVNALDRGIIPTDHMVEYNSLMPNEDMKRGEVSELLYRMKVLNDNGSFYYYSWETPFEIGAVPFYETCTLTGEVQKSDLALEKLIPADSEFVFSVDYSGLNKNDFDSFWAKIPHTFVDDFFANEILNSSDQVVLDVFNGEPWQFLFGRTASETQDYGFYVLGKSANVGALVFYLEKEMWMSYKSDFDCSVDDSGALIWTYEGNDMYYWISGDVFVLTNTLENRDALIKRYLENGASFSKPDDVKNKLSYVYVGESLWQEVSFLFHDLYAGTDYLNMLVSILDMNAWFDVNSNSLEMGSNVSFDADSDFYKIYGDYDLSLYNKVPADGLVFYYEAPDFAYVFDLIAQEYGISVLDLYDAMAGSYGYDVYDETLALMAEKFSVTEDQIHSLFSSPFAMFASDLGDVVPGVVLYLDVEESDYVLADKMLDDLMLKVKDNFVSDVDWSMLVDQSVYLTEDGRDYNGLKRMTFDFSQMPDSTDYAFNDLVFDFYYGVNSDGIMVLAMYPNFDESYGRNSLALNTKFKDAKASVYSSFGSQMTFVNFENLMKFADNWVEFINLSEMDLSDYNLVKSFVSSFDYLVSASKIGAGVLSSDMILELK